MSELNIAENTLDGMFICPEGDTETKQGETFQSIVEISIKAKICRECVCSEVSKSERGPKKKSRCELQR